MPKTAVIALGGNAITSKDKEDTIANQFSNTRISLAGIIELIKKDYRLVISHGNGPQVGNAILRVELGRGKAPILPLGICVADTEGGMGYMIEQSLQNRLKLENIEREIATIITQVVVNKDDPEMIDPKKYIGQFYSKDEAQLFEKERGWVMKNVAGSDWRRVVPSPLPQRIVESKIIKLLVENNVVVIAVGGGGIPVYIKDDGTYEGVDAVIDKDRASAILANEILAQDLIVLTGVDHVCLNYDKENEKIIKKMTVTEAEKYLLEGQFPAGSMGPKIESAISFLKNGGERVVITSIGKAAEAVSGEAGTILVAG